MDYRYYERKLNDVILKCPIEAGVEILAYRLLDDIIDMKELSLVDINRIWKNQDARLTTEGGIPDIAVLSNDFQFGEECGRVYGFVEVKATNKHLAISEQVKGQKKKVKHYLFTNGLVWKYFVDGNEEWEMALAFCDSEECKVMSKYKNISIDANRFEILLSKLKSINWVK